METATKDYKGLRAAAIALLAVVSVVLLLNWMGINENGQLVAVLFVPLLVYGVISGRISELRGPGGWEARFREAASKTIKLPAASIDLKPEDMEIVPKLSIPEMRTRIAVLAQRRPVALTLEAGRGADFYKSFAISDAIRRLQVFPEFVLVAIIDSAKRLVCYIPAGQLRDELDQGTPEAHALVEHINSGQTEKILDHPGIKVTAAEREKGNAAALRIMESEDADALPVVDEDRRFLGVIGRDRIVTDMLLSLTSSSQDAA